MEEDKSIPSMGIKLMAVATPNDCQHRWAHSGDGGILLLGPDMPDAAQYPDAFCYFCLVRADAPK